MLPGESIVEGRAGCIFQGEVFDPDGPGGVVAGRKASERRCGDVRCMFSELSMECLVLGDPRATFSNDDAASAITALISTL